MASLPLEFAKSGEDVRVIRVSGNDAVKQHLQDLGFVPGSEIHIISTHDGDMIISLKGTKLAITRDMAKKIHVAD